MLKKNKIKKIEARLEVVEKEITYYENLSREVTEMRFILMKLSKSDNDDETVNTIKEIEEKIHNLNCYFLGSMFRLMDERDVLDSERWRLIH